MEEEWAGLGTGKPPGGTLELGTTIGSSTPINEAAQEAEKEGEKEEEAPPSFGTLMRVFSYGSPADRALQFICVFAAVCSGAAMPLMALVMGRLTANFTDFGSEGNTQSGDLFMHQVRRNALYLVYLFIGKFSLVYIWSFGFTFAANRMVQALRLKCLNAILNRTVSAHDNQTPGTLSNTITTHCNSIQAALSDRIGIMIQAFSMLIAAFAVAFSQSWQLTLVMLGLVFLTLGLIGAVVGSDQKIEAGLLKRYAECSAIAEDALGSIKTVVAFGAADKFLAKYEKVLVQAESEGKKRGPLVGLMFACQYFFMFTGWAIGFYLGAYLYRHGKISDPGRILSVFFAMLIGLGAIMALGPNMPSFIKAIAASGDVFKIVDNVELLEPKPESDESESTPSALNGHVELRNLSFTYPSRPDRNALSGINVQFAKGTSTAIGFDTIVGDQGSLISGGQKQRIAIARALIGRRPILLMDEATSALDGENSKVIESLMNASENRTTIFISHKIVNAMQASQIVVLEKGKLAEQGTHHELMEANGLYKRLFDVQTRIEDEHKEEIAAFRPSEKLSLAKIASKRFLPIFLIGVGACVITAQIFPAQAIILGRVLQTFQGNADNLKSKANFWSLMFFVVGLGALISYAILGFFMTLLGVYLTKFYRREYFRSVLLQPMEFFDRMASGALIQRLSSDPSNLHDLISVNLGLLISIAISIVSGSAIALAFSWKFALVAIFGAMPAVFAAGFVRMKLDSSLAEATAKIFEDSAKFASDSLSAIRTVKAFTMEETVKNSYQEHLLVSIVRLYKKTAAITLFFALSESVELLAAALAFWYGGKLLKNGETTTERFFTVFLAVVVGGQAAGALFGFSSNIGKAKVAANNILGIRGQIRKSGAVESLPSVNDEKSTGVVVDFNNVSFAYPARPDAPVLKNVSLQIHHGQTVAIVGSSGSGKSTLLALLERFYDAQSGSITIFGNPIAAYDVDKYRKRLAIVPQEPKLYKGSIRDNVVLGVDESQVQDADVVNALDAANLTDLIASLPDGYNSDCGAKGTTLSGGQKQRVAIARALIRDPELLLLDEPTSALDAESERQVSETLSQIQKGRTMILVTHRMNTVRNADVIIVMSAGQIIEQGSHSELMALQGQYFKMQQAARGEEL
ncbi:Leptomycin B resistance protein pmd1 [Escovopsis weberi]|uniref:ABC-type transmembrane transporter etpA n=1 Tax=Escovopsis weberi TaxID=150374 RepID=ETPA_ESCWE|nr:Leptomycin B resistance protein pmd1 [Escovopsis weberi]DAB41657.1 TPA_exp: ABC transporter [Escovopsis weberi]